MTDLEKATFALDLTSSLLELDRKILAVKFVMKLYGSSLKEANRFVDVLQAKLYEHW